MRRIARRSAGMGMGMGWVWESGQEGGRGSHFAWDPSQRKSRWNHCEPPAEHKVIALAVQTELTNKLRLQGSLGFANLKVSDGSSQEAKLVPTHRRGAAHDSDQTAIGRLQ